MELIGIRKEKAKVVQYLRIMIEEFEENMK